MLPTKQDTPCADCGSSMKRRGSTYYCHNCGAVCSDEEMAVRVVQSLEEEFPE